MKKKKQPHPPPKIAAMGHDRCPVFPRWKNLDLWIQTAPKNDTDFYALLNDLEESNYAHQWN